MAAELGKRTFDEDPSKEEGTDEITEKNCGKDERES
jgi:hypothetical protein